ncbi:hypothetical protein GCM10007380_15470 [Gottfriedia solisilvae]|uniref:Uncharacterized protein n=1 Tax=Gottfriedia solisilvae TaxID=1516104 RepID=A0A8J3EXK2_9BACI|nr:hypothetical protein GCM10007380_15470 [Gottfriedia solisilvae]
MIKKKKYRIITTIIYLCSFLVIFPVSIPLYAFLTFLTDDPNASVDFIFILYSIFISILGSYFLNLIFRPLLCDKNKNDKITWSIFVAQLFLIPLSVGPLGILFF